MTDTTTRTARELAAAAGAFCETMMAHVRDRDPATAHVFDRLVAVGADLKVIATFGADRVELALAIRWHDGREHIVASVAQPVGASVN